MALTVSSFLSLINNFGPAWGWLLTLAWVTWQLYCPITNHTTKLQSWHDALTARFERIETGQVALAEQVDGADTQRIKRLHDRSTLTTDDLQHTVRDDMDSQTD